MTGMLAGSYMKMEDTKAKAAGGEYNIVDNMLLPAILDDWEKFDAITHGDSNAVGGFAACEQHHKGFAKTQETCGQLEKLLWESRITFQEQNSQSLCV